MTPTTFATAPFPPHAPLGSSWLPDGHVLAVLNHPDKGDALAIVSQDDGGAWQHGGQVPIGADVSATHIRRVWLTLVAHAWRRRAETLLGLTPTGGAS